MRALTKSQTNLVQRAAAMLPPQTRDGFFRSIANRLCALPHPTDYDVADAVNVVLNGRGIGGGNKAFIRPKQAKGVFK